MVDATGMFNRIGIAAIVARGRILLGFGQPSEGRNHGPDSREWRALRGFSDVAILRLEDFAAFQAVFVGSTP